MIRLPHPMEQILHEVEREFIAEAAQAFREAFQATELAADDCPVHLRAAVAIARICARPWPLQERLDAIDVLVNVGIPVLRPA
jgi:hypothetical protein